MASCAEERHHDRLLRSGRAPSRCVGGSSDGGARVIDLDRDRAHVDATLERCFVQFMHPGGEHGPDASDLKLWNMGEHKRKFIRLEGESLDSAAPSARARSEELVFWAEWEPESEVEPINDPIPMGPQWLHRPFFATPTAFRQGERGLQNTDPFVYGDRFLYTLCRQWKRSSGGAYGPTYLRDLEIGSLILFGSHKWGEFLLDTVFVVGSSVLHDARSWEDVLVGRVPDAYADVTLRPTYVWEGPEKLRLYQGATPRDRVDGMFSFAPCLPAAEAPSGFPRPTIRLEDLITPGLMMGSKATRSLSREGMRDIWSSVVDQVLEQGLELGTRFDVPERRGG
jgi:hypothetical protein